MNFQRKFSWKIISCENCKRKLILKKQKRTLWYYIISALFWMTIPVIFIILTALGIISAFVSIFGVILYHVLCFVYIIGFYNYSEVKK